MKNVSTYPKDSQAATERVEMMQLIEEAIELKSSHPNLAIQKAEQASKIAFHLGEYSHFAKSQNTIGVSQFFQGNNNAAIQILEENLRFIREHLFGDIENLADAYKLLGATYASAGEYQTALDTLLIARSFSYLPAMPMIYNNLGVVYEHTGDMEKAMEAWEMGLEAVDKESNARDYALLAYNLAFARFDMGRNLEAKKGFEDMLELSEQTKGKKNGVSGRIHIRSLNMLGEVYRVEKKYDIAFEFQQQALKLAESENFIPLSCDIFIDIAKIHFERGEEASGISCLLKALDYTKKDKLYPEQKRTLNEIINHYKKTDNLHKAFPYLQQLYALQEEQIQELRGKNFRKIISERDKEIQLLETKNREIEAHNAILEQYARIISHDLREPVRSIANFSNLLDKKYSELLGKEGKEYINFILSETNSINTNLARLLKYASFKKPKQDEIVEVKLSQIIKEIKQEYAVLSFQLKITFDDIRLNMKPAHARTLFYELIDNAVQFRKQDADCRIEIEHKVEGKQLWISVKDYGIGIAPDYHKKVFKIFNQLNKQASDRAGVGLAICERIVHLYKGKISIESIPNQSTTFHINIPK